jgi:hypothetical protein
MQRVAYVIAGLFLAANAVYMIVSLWITGRLLTLALLLAPILAALALGTMLVIRNVRKHVEEPEPESEVGGEIP